MTRVSSKIQKAAVTLCVLLLPLSVGFGQALPPTQPGGQPPLQQDAPLLSPQQLDNLVAPVALYPDPLLGQVLAASTYPLEIAEAQQWLQRNGNLQGAQLTDAARQQDWDPSVQALVAFPDVMKLLGNDLRWTTDLGNAFLAQQADVMAAVQRMRSRAQSNGRLQSSPQQVVTTQNENGQSAIEIQPADPQVIYVPVYQPEYVYGPPVWGAYPDLWYPPGFGYGFGFGPGIYAAGFFPGWVGWGGWGWGLGWYGGGYGRGLFVNAGFFNRYGYRAGLGAGGFGGRSQWAHDPGHRMGVSYPNQNLASRYSGGGSRFNGSSRASAGFAQSTRGGVGAGGNGGYRNFNGSNGANRAATNGYSGVSRAASPNYRGGGNSQAYQAAPAQNYRGSNPGGSNFRGMQSYARPASPSYSAPRGQSYSAPRSYSAPSAPRQSFSAPRSYSAPSAPRQSFSAPRSSGGGFPGGGGGFSVGHSGGGGGGGGHASGGGGGGHGGGRR